MKIRITLAIFMCKLTRGVLRLFRRGGTALPGKVAIKICPDLLKHLAKDVKSVAITGTNGKTTSARMLEQFFIDSGAGYFTNKSGSNLLRGITAEFAINATMTGKPKREYAIIECDEAASKKVFEYLNPAVVLVTNVFADQLDRFGDIGAILENIRIGVKNAPNASVCLNADDPLTSSIADDIPNKVVFYVVNTEIYKGQADELYTSINCIHCGNAYEYDYRTYGHLGGFRCAACGFARKNPDVAVIEITMQDADSQTVKLCAFDETSDVTINLPGGYNIYNAAGAIAASEEMGFSLEAAKAAMMSFECGFGRMEKFDLGGVLIRMILVKNAVGCSQALSYLCSLPDEIMIAISINDRIADGTDISWIQDVGFEKLLDMGVKLRGILVSGIRAEDMAGRLADAGIPDEQIRVFKDQGEMLEAALGQDAPVLIMPTYTAMLELRSIISKKFGVKEYWE